MHFISVDETATFQRKDTPRKRMQTFLNFVHSPPNTQEWEQWTTVSNVFERELTSWRRCSIGNSVSARLRFQGVWRKRLLWVPVFLLKAGTKAGTGGRHEDLQHKNYTLPWCSPKRGTKRPTALTNPGQVSVPTTLPCLALSSKRNCHKMPHNSTSLCSLSPYWFLALGLSPNVWLGSTSQCNCRAEFPVSSPDTHSLFVGLCSGPSWCTEAMTVFFHPWSGWAALSE